MADQKLELTVRVNSDTGQLDIVSQKLRTLGQDAEKASSSAKTAGAGFSDMAKAIGGIASAGAVAAFFKSAVQGAEEENQALRRLKFAVEAAGGSFKDAQGQIQQWAQGIQAATRFTDGQAIDTMARFVRVTGDNVQAQKASQLAMSLSVATGKDLATTTDVLTNIINKNERGIAMARKEFGAFIGGAENGQQVLNILAARFGDAAMKEEGFSKATSSLSNNWNELKDTVGNAVIPMLTVFVGWLNKGVDATRAIGDALAAVAATALISAESIGKAVLAVARRDFGSLAGIAKDAWVQIDAITASASESIRQEFEKTAAAHSVHADAMVEVTRARSAAEIAEEKKANDERVADMERVAQMTAEIERQILAMNQDTLQQKMALLNAETSAQRDKINREIVSERGKEQVLAQLDRAHAARVIALNKAEAIAKRETAFKVVEDTLQTLSIINSMQTGHTRAQVARARILLALEKAIAIARLWSAEAGKGIAGVAIASAGTALIAAQFAQQSKAIGQAASMSDGTTEFKSSTDLGNGQTFSEVSTSGATSVSGGVAAGRPGAPAAAGGGGGPTNIINVGGVVVNFSAGTVDLSQLDVILRRIADEVLRGTTAGVQFAIAVRTVGEQNAGVAR
ncbi:MAG: hypothetical protein E6Q97_34930 [Desulfurellales bacterium]|nr:MAG: hypothetical protein E6Q97_34930 [Desulfurellales bacterium]